MTADWMEGDTTMAVPLEITQEGASFTATVTGFAALYLDGAVGSHVFTGQVSGSHLDGTLRGTGRGTGTCAYTLNVDMDADLSGDVMTGHSSRSTAPARRPADRGRSRARLSDLQFQI